MLIRLQLENFKCWKTAELTLGRITGIFGTNSSGKSSLLQSLLLLKQTREATDRAVVVDLNGRWLRLGTLEDVIHNHDRNVTMNFAVGFRTPSPITIRDSAARSRKPIVSSSEVEIKTKTAFDLDAPSSHALLYRVGEATFSLTQKIRFAPFHLHADVPGSDFGLVSTPERPEELDGPIKTYRFPDDARSNFRNTGFLSDLETAFEAFLDRTFYLGPLRDHPQRDYLWSRSRPSDVGDRGEHTIEAIVAAQTDGDRRNLAPERTSFTAALVHWLRKLHLAEEFHVEEIAAGSNRWQAKVRTRRDGSEVMLPDVGFGVSQVLPVITLLHYVPPGSTVLLEQPEIHLHPLAQAELADVIIDVAERRRVQVIVESHSEHLLLRLQRRIAEGRLNADDISLYFCSAARGASEIERLQLDEYGNIGNWPARFMGDAFAETAEAELARLARMGNSAS